MPLSWQAEVSLSRSRCAVSFGRCKLFNNSKFVFTSRMLICVSASSVPLLESQLGSWSATLFFVSLHRSCSGLHKHTVLTGKVQGPNGKFVFATKPAQEYPIAAIALCEAMALVVRQIVDHSLSQFALSLPAPKLDGKRKLGSPGGVSRSSGYQLKRCAAKPFFDVECESGVAIQWSLHVLHPFTVQSVLPDQLLDNIDLIASWWINASSSWPIGKNALAFFFQRVILNFVKSKILRSAAFCAELQTTQL